MGRRKKGRNINGVLLLNKAVGGSSNQVLQKVRWMYQAKKAGHTGALDPLASGMLPICLGEATKFSQFLLDADKTYQVTAKLGQRTTTSDADGDIVASKAIHCSNEDILAAIKGFVGKSKQIPSMFSALKYQGKPLYFYARQGLTVPREPRDINVYSIEQISIDLPYVSMQIHCSKGTYIRTIIDDLGEKLGCGAYVSQLHRSKVAHYPSDKMLSLEQLEALLNERGLEGLDDALLPMDTAIQQLDKVAVNQSIAHGITQGRAFTVNVKDFTLGGLVGMYAEDKRFLGVGEVQENGLIQPKRVVVYE